MKKRISTVFIISAFSMLLIGSCQSPAKKENPAIERAEQQLRDFRDRIDAIGEKDPQMKQKVKAELQQFRQIMDTLTGKLRQEGDTAHLEVQSKISEIKEESRELDQKLDTWTGQQQDSIDSLGVEIRKDFRDFKEALNEKIRDERNNAGDGINN